MPDAPSSGRKQYATSRLAVTYPDTYPRPEKVRTNMISVINQISQPLIAEQIDFRNVFSKHDPFFKFVIRFYTIDNLSFEKCQNFIFKSVSFKILLIIVIILIFHNVLVSPRLSNDF